MRFFGEKMAAKGAVKKQKSVDLRGKNGRKKAGREAEKGSGKRLKMVGESGRREVEKGAGKRLKMVWGEGQ